MSTVCPFPYTPFLSQDEQRLEMIDQRRDGLMVVDARFVFCAPTEIFTLKSGPSVNEQSVDEIMAVLDQSFLECQNGEGSPLSELFDEPDSE